MAKELQGNMEEIVLDIQREFLPHVFNLGLALQLEMQSSEKSR